MCAFIALINYLSTSKTCISEVSGETADANEYLMDC